jgi:phospholipid/cholesterol/gamma-HCH transport system ATP-binding protein
MTCDIAIAAPGASFIQAFSKIGLIPDAGGSWFLVERLGLARAMALDPAILFLDEPSAGLDPVTSAGLDELIRALSRDFGMTFVIASHELASIYAIADRVIMLDEGRIVAEGQPQDLRDRPPNEYVRAFFRREPENKRAA